MKRVAFSLLSAVALSTGILAFSPLSPAQARQLQQNATPSVVGQAPSNRGAASQRIPSPLEQRRLDELNRAGNQNGSLRRQPAATPTDIEPAGAVQMSHLQHMRLTHLDNR